MGRKIENVSAPKRFAEFFDWAAGPGHLYSKGDDPEDFLDVSRVKLVRRP